MFPLRHLAPLCAALALLAGCGGGGDPATRGPTTTPTTPTTPAPGVGLAALPGSAQHATLTWTGGSAGSTWRLERRVGESGDYALVAEVDGGAGLWLDGGLSADTRYGYRLRRADGTVLATAAVRTGTEPVLTTAAPAAVGSAVSLPVTPTTSRLRLADGSLQLDLPAGSLGQAGTATLQPIVNPLPDGAGPGMSLSLPERPARTLTLSLRYGADEDVDEVLQDRIALRQADGSWWLLPLSGHDEAQRLLQVNLPPGLWVAQPATTARQARAAAVSVAGVKGELVRVKAHKLVPAAATVRLLGSRRFVPVSIYAMRDEPCEETQADEELCVPQVVLRDVQLPIRNTRAGFQRQWTLEGSATPAAALGTLAPEAQAGVVYTAPARVPGTNPVTLRFRSVDNRNGRRLTLSARIRVAEDAWVGTLDALIGDLAQGHYFKLDMRWSLDGAQSTATRRVYRPGGSATHLYTVLDDVCQHTVSPASLPLAQADITGQLVVDESASPPRYTLAMSARWNSTLTVRCPTGSTSAPIVGGHAWSAEGVVVNERIAGSDNSLGERTWSLGRPQ